MIRGCFALVRLVNWFCCSRIVRGNLIITVMSEGCIADGTVSGFRILCTYVVVAVVVVVVVVV